MMGKPVGILDYAVPGRPWVKIAAFNDAVEANIARLKLEAEDIPCVLEGENVGVALGYTAPALFSIGLRVPEEYAEAANALLNETPEAPAGTLQEGSSGEAEMDDTEAMPAELSGDGEEEEDSSPARPAEQCPACGQRGEVYLWRRRLMLVLLCLGVGTVGGAGVNQIFVMLAAGAGVYLLLTKPDYLCPKCGKSWTERDESA